MGKLHAMYKLPITTSLSMYLFSIKPKTPKNGNTLARSYYRTNPVWRSQYIFKQEPAGVEIPTTIILFSRVALAVISPDQSCTMHFRHIPRYHIISATGFLQNVLGPGCVMYALCGKTRGLVTTVRHAEK